MTTSIYIWSILFIIFMAWPSVQSVSVNPCVLSSSASRCKNGGLCRPLSAYNFTCSCDALQWQGRYCEEPTLANPCYSNPCRFNSTCLLDQAGTKAYVCACAPGYMGLNCDKQIDRCESNPCYNNGICTNRDEYGVDKVNYYRCICRPGFTSINCEVQISPCASTPCLNSGLCFSKINSYQCLCLPGFNGTRCEYDNNNSSLSIGATCQCLSGYSGQRCEIQLNQCSFSNNPCNSGICVDKPYNKFLPFSCFCLPGTTGVFCESSVDLCASGPCLYGAKCTQPSNFTYNCDCPIGTTGKNCETDINECSSSPCQNNGTCMEASLNQYTCVCPSSYTGPSCEILVTADCKCLNGGVCLLTTSSNSTQAVLVKCLCLDGYTGELCEKSLSGCESSPCLNNGTCVKQLNNAYKCACSYPFTGVNCETEYSKCDQQPCLNGGVCKLGNDSVVTCQCSGSFTGRFCETRLGVCATSHPCGPNGQCFQQTLTNYTCFCHTGYTGTHCEIQIDPCSSSPCKNGASCSSNSTLGLFSCSCTSGFTGVRCDSTVLPCDSSPCLNDGLCFNNNSYYSCVCSPAYSGLNCETVVNPCFQVDCSGHGTCSEQFAEAVCNCQTGYYGDNCQFSLDFCASIPCQNAGQCASNSSGYTCTCLVGFSGVNCELITDPCSGYCFNNGTCFQTSSLQVGCTCPCGWQGLRCETPVSICAKNSQACQNGATCIDNNQNCDFQCQCPCNYTGRFCDQPINPCFNSSSGVNFCQNNAVCVPDGCNFTCQCSPGFTGRLCDVLISPCDPNPCVNGFCVPSRTDYTCKCPCESYWGKNCQYYNSSCDSHTSSKCQNGGTCTPTGCEITCSCLKFYTGQFCETPADPCSYNTCYNNGTCISDALKGLFKCQCSPFFTGADCSIPLGLSSPCLSSPCDMNKQCVENTSLRSYECTCPPFYTGESCSIRIRSCSSSPCHTGQCMEDLLTGAYICTCPIGITGEQCDTTIDNCASRPCLNNATCTQLSTPNLITCICPSGYTGSLCQTRIDFCLSYPCHHGKCITQQDGYQCVCDFGYSGSKCELFLNTCYNQNCSNNGSCISLGSSYKCICSPGYTGNDCQHLADPCISSPCLNSGVCQSNSIAWSCLCQPGWSGLRCTNRLLACSSSPCENGFCNEISNDFGFHCTCLPGWTGLQCSTEIDECSPNQCLNGGLCVQNRPGSFKCICQPGYSGPLCQTVIDACSSNPCVNSLGCVSNSGTFKCQCMDGFYGERCNILELKYQNPTSLDCRKFCQNGATCLLASNTSVPDYKCLCPRGFTGQRCELINEPCLSSPCLYGKCTSPRYGIFKCYCDPGYTGFDCSVKIDACANRPCINGFCTTSNSGIFSCVCPEGFTGRYCEVSLNYCSQNPCQNGGICMYPYSYNTSCSPGLTGLKCDAIIDVCSSSPCISPNATCVLTGPNEFKCICPEYQTGRLCEKQVNLCESVNPCPSHINCTQISFTETKCICPPGFTGQLCTEQFDPCLSSPCVKGACVSPLPGVFRCACQSGYVGTFCSEQIILCDYISCLNGGTCVNSTSGFLCTCPPSFTGTFCERPVDLCASDPTLCSPNGVCYNLYSGEYYCKCTNSCYYGQKCELAYDPCSFNPCLNSGTCSPVSTSSNCSYTCSCPKLFTGASCEFNLSPCLTLATPCFNNGTCLLNDSSANGYSCQCETGFSGSYCEIQSQPSCSLTCLNGGFCLIDSVFQQPVCYCQNGFTGIDCGQVIDFCAQLPCLNNATCHSTTTGFQCECSPGFGGSNCQLLIDTCSLYHPCSFGTCHRSYPGQYICSCYPGYTGQNCSEPISNCQSNPCMFGSCVDNVVGYWCVCSNGYTGVNCSEPIDECLFNPCLNGVCVSKSNSSLSSSGLSLPFNSSYECQCIQGFTGADCSVQADFCAGNNCTTHGTCISTSPSLGFYFCSCEAGYTGDLCEQQLDRCELISCYNGGTCLSNGTQLCDCLPGFSGTLCETRLNMCDAEPCLNSGKCVGDSNFYICECPTNYVGRDCEYEQTECDENNPCENSAVCRVLDDGRYQCLCTPGWTGIYCDKLIDACDSQPCMNNGTCARYNFTGFVCACSAGFKGSYCQSDINECSLSPCQNGGSCTNTYGSYKCTCSNQFTGRDCSIPITDPCEYSECQPPGGKCVSSGFGEITCQCQRGYTGLNCDQIVHPCSSSPCQSNSTCIEQLNTFSYVCQCSSGFYGVNCELSVDVCNLSKPCGPYGTCTSINGSNYSCSCMNGVNGTNCNNIISYCASNPCRNGAQCVDLIGSYYCLCQRNHSSIYYGVNCELIYDPCDNFNCYNNGTCSSSTSTTPKCLCDVGYTGPNCQFKIDNSTTTNCSITCLNGGICNSTGNGCVCQTHFGGSDCSLIVDYCALLGNNLCRNGATCSNTSDGYVCICPPGYTGTFCQNLLSVCDSNPCGQNGLCIASNSSTQAYKCHCFQPYTGDNCTTKLSLCDYISCGFGSCVQQDANEFKVTCVCEPSYTGKYCNIVLNGSACVSSPCQNGGTCSSLSDGNYTCSCTNEYTGPNCQTLKPCIEGFDYCSSMPCLNSATCQLNSNCSISCICDTSISFGQFCQYLVKESVYSEIVSLDVLKASCSAQMNFNIEMKPCLVSAWQNANYRFSCPAGYSLVTGLGSNCFQAASFSQTQFTKNMAAYQCGLGGASLISFESQNKLNIITSWLYKQSFNASYFWLNTGKFRYTSLNGSSIQVWYWSNSMVPINYNWAPGQSDLFNGDSVYLNTTDFKFYVGTQSLSAAQAGVVCQSSIKGMSSDQIVINLLNQTELYSGSNRNCKSTCGTRFVFSVNITLNQSVGISEIKSPNLTSYKNALRSCGKAILTSNDKGEVFHLNQSFYVDICGLLNCQGVNQIKYAIRDSWLIARPELLWCNQNRKCLKINIIKNETIALNQWNALTRIHYVVTVNGVALDPSQVYAGPTPAILSEQIGNKRRNFYQAYVLCGASPSIANSTRSRQTIYLDSVLNPNLPPISNSPFPLPLNYYITAYNNPLRTNLINAIRNAIMALNPFAAGLDTLEVNLDQTEHDLLVLKSFSDTVRADTICITPSQVVYPVTMASFTVFIQGVQLSYSTQSVYNDAALYFQIQQNIYADPMLKSFGLVSYTPWLNPIIQPFESLLRLKLTTRVASLDLPVIQEIILDWIFANSIEFNNCKYCWNDTRKLIVKYVYTDTLIDSVARRYYDVWFAVIITDDFSGRLTVADLSNEPDYLRKFKLTQNMLYAEINEIQVRFRAPNNYMIFNPTLTDIRRKMLAISLHLNMSLLHEDIEPVKGALRANIQTIKGESFSIEYWGQIEYIRNQSDFSSFLYWEAIFFVVTNSTTCVNRRIPSRYHSTELSQNASQVLNPVYDYEFDQQAVINFFQNYQGIRGVIKYAGDLGYSQQTDFATQDLFYLPCFGPVPIEHFSLIFSIAARIWTETYANTTIQNSFKQAPFYNFMFQYINEKGTYTVLGYVVQDLNGNQLTPDVYGDPSYERLRSALCGLCDLHNGLNDIYTGLNFVDAMGAVSIDQAQNYKPAITDAYRNYFVSIDPQISLYKPTEIVSVEYLLVNCLVVSRIYYKVFANTPQPLNTFNYQIQLTPYKINLQYMPCVAGQTTHGRNIVMIEKNGRALATRVVRASTDVKDVVISWLPQFSVELSQRNEFQLAQKQTLENFLATFWHKTLAPRNDQKVYVQLINYESYYDTDKFIYTSRINYLLMVGNNLRYKNQLTNDPHTQEMFRSQLYKLGFKLINSTMHSSKIRFLYFDLNSRVADFNFDRTSQVIRNVWSEYLRRSSFSSFKFTESTTVQALVIDQGLYYHNTTQLVGLKYIVTIDHKDPFLSYGIPDPTSSFVEGFFVSLKLSSYSGLAARRLYVYSSLIHNTKQFKDQTLMKTKITEIWLKKNSNNQELQDPIHSTNFYSFDDNDHLMSNIPCLPLYRITYTHSVNGLDPALVFYEAPNQNDFNKELLDMSNPYIMGFCMRSCFNYRHSVILINPIYTDNKMDMLDAIQEAWLLVNSLKTTLVNHNILQVYYLNNLTSFPIDKTSGMATVHLSVTINSKLIKSQFDSLDLHEPSAQDYLDSLRSLHAGIRLEDISVDAGWRLLSTTSKPQQNAHTQIMISIQPTIPEFESKTSYWLPTALTILAIVLVASILVKINCVAKSVRFKKTGFSSNEASSSSSANTSSLNTSENSGARLHRAHRLDDIGDDDDSFSPRLLRLPSNLPNMNDLQQAFHNTAIPAPPNKTGRFFSSSGIHSSQYQRQQLSSGLPSPIPNPLYSSSETSDYMTNRSHHANRIEATSRPKV